MCFSATASFGASAVLGTIGIMAAIDHIYILSFCYGRVAAMGTAYHPLAGKRCKE